jgi:hypothetical protein
MWCFVDLPPYITQPNANQQNENKNTWLGIANLEQKFFVSTLLTRRLQVRIVMMEGLKQ